MVYEYLIYFIKNDVRNWTYVKEVKKTINKLRKLGEEQIRNRIKLIQEDAYIPNDLLSIILQGMLICSFNQLVRNKIEILFIFVKKPKSMM
jgi:hypothetical protein